MPVADLTLLEQAARKAGELLLTHCDGSFLPSDNPEDPAPVTQAELAVNYQLRDKLIGAWPFSRGVSE